MAQDLSPDLRLALKHFAERVFVHPYASFGATKQRDVLRQMGLIERWNPSLKVTGRLKPWRLTAAGRAVLAAKDAPQ